MGFFTWIKRLGRRGSNPPCGGGEITRAQWDAMRTAFPNPPTKPQPTGGRLIYGDRDPGPVPSRLPDDLADLPSDEQMERWKRAAIAEYQQGGEPTWRTAALLAFAEGRQQAQSLQIPPPGADPVVTDEELMEELKDLRPNCMPSTVRRTLYQRGRADERTAILRALGLQP